jgi:hypothetical protein
MGNSPMVILVGFYETMIRIQEVAESWYFYFFYFFFRFYDFSFFFYLLCSYFFRNGLFWKDDFSGILRDRKVGVFS